MADTRGMADTKVGDRIRVTKLGVLSSLLTVGMEVEVRGVERRGNDLWVNPGGGYPPLVAGAGDKWCVVAEVAT